MVRPSPSRRSLLLLFLLLYHRYFVGVHRRNRDPVIMNDAICVRDITREPLAAAIYTCISGSRCVTRLIKIPRDLLRRAFAAGSWRTGRKRSRKREKEREGRTERKREMVGETRGDDEWTHAEEKRRWKRVRATYSVAALSSTHVVSTQFAMKYRGDHRHARTIITGCPHLAGCCTQLPLSRDPRSLSLSLSRLRAEVVHLVRFLSCPLSLSLPFSLFMTFVFLVYSLREPCCRA